MDIYKTTNIINNHIYIGKRQLNYFDAKYFGSGKRLRYELNKYGKENFICEVLAWAKTIDELYSLEEYYISQYFDEHNCINCKRTSVGGDTVSGTFKITNGVEEKNISSEEDIPKGWYKGSKTKGIPHPSINYSKIWTEEKRNEWSLKFSGINNPNFGKGCFGIKNGRLVNLVPKM